MIKIHSKSIHFYWEENEILGKKWVPLQPTSIKPRWWNHPQPTQAAKNGAICRAETLRRQGWEWIKGMVERLGVFFRDFIVIIEVLSLRSTWEVKCLVSKQLFVLVGFYFVC